MKILQISKFYPPVAGGIEALAFALTEGLNRAGHRTDVLCANTQWQTRRERAAGGYQITRAASLGLALSTAMSPRLAAEARALVKQFDVIHLQMPDPMAALALWWARPRAKVILHWHSDVIRQKQALRLYEPLQDWLLRRADAVVATTRLYAEASPWLRKYRAKVSVVPIGIADPRPAVRDDLVAAFRQRFAGRRIVFSLGRMTYYKGFEYLIDAAAALPEDVIVVVGGYGELLETHREDVRARGMEKRIEFIGRIAESDLASCFAAADLFVLPSVVRAEAYGVVILEAMAAGRPVVATSIEGSGVPWVNLHGVTGINVPVRDGAALAAAIRFVLDNPAAASRLGAAGRDRFLAEFTEALMVERMARLYSTVLSTRGTMTVAPSKASP